MIRSMFTVALFALFVVCSAKGSRSPASDSPPTPSLEETGGANKGNPERNQQQNAVNGVAGRRMPNDRGQIYTQSGKTGFHGKDTSRIATSTDGRVSPKSPTASSATMTDTRTGPARANGDADRF